MELTELYQRMEQIKEEFSLEGKMTPEESKALENERDMIDYAIHVMEENNIISIKSITVTNIEWETDTKEELKSLPRELTIPIDTSNAGLLDDIMGYAEELSDYLSDSYGYCTYYFSTTMNGEVKKDPQALS